MERAAALGNVRAMYLMAEMFFPYIDRARYPDTRAYMSEWHLKAAEAGHACAMGRMAQAYRFGWGVPVDKEKSLAWYRKATAAGVVMSPYGYEIDGEQPRGPNALPILECPRET